VAVNRCQLSTTIEGFAGVTAIDTSTGAVIVTVAEADLVVSSTLAAVTVTGFVLGTELGAV
jgi:hypothetical protein